MIAQIDAVIERLQHEANTEKNIVNIEFTNIYKGDKEFVYKINKAENEVVVNYKGVVYAFPLPTITFKLRPPVTWLWFKEVYVHEVTNTFKLQYSLAMYYNICVHTYYKNKLNNNLNNKEND